MQTIDVNAVIFKVLVLFIVMLSGIYARKRNIMTSESKKAFSAFLVGVINPLLMITSFNIEYNSELVKKGIVIFFISFLVHFTVILLAKFIYKFEKNRDDNAVFIFATAFANVGYLGFPVMQAVFGNIGLFYGAFYHAAFNIAVWSYGIMLMQKESKAFDLKKLFNPSFVCTIAGILIFLFKIPIPEIVIQPVSLVANMAFPLSMVIIGALLAEIDLRTLFDDKRLYLYSFVKLLLLPVCAVIICKLFKANALYANLIVIFLAMPAASITAVVGELYDTSPSLAAKCVGISTLFSVITLPLVIYLAGALL